MIAMFYRTSRSVIFRLDKVIAVYPLNHDDTSDDGTWCAVLDGSEEDVRLSKAEALAVVELLEQRFGIV